ncbi:GNAT family N-acetyltransferase [Methylobacterium oryzihabitans]|uniref:GNAT family N-acetyltransferase n=1 Tax=Methylobacterium oryzihabitans TaxID=2499852 RepID=A0A3S3U9G8_9HYPH|nr:GNAT family N-acetyltransferase [Methylobacterium oryzihabitans]RVU18666.1 GNAT family N-acetyltransferase [Methylobacterium oryzihabitans]
MSPVTPGPRPSLRTMRPDDLALVLDWAAAEGWNPGLSDAAAFHAADPGGFLLALDGGNPVGAISVVAYGDAFGFLGLYLVRPEFRGQGIGTVLWSAGLARLGARSVGLDGVVAQQANYARSGFAALHRTLRFSGTPAVPAGPPAGPWDGSDVAEIAAFDAEHFGAPRHAFLRGWLAAPGHRVAVSRRDGRIDGYGVVRPCREGFKIGPLFCASRATAETLFAALAAAAGEGATLVLDVPEPNRDGLALARDHGLAPVFETARMVRGPAPDRPLARIYGVTTLELG